MHDYVSWQDLARETTNPPVTSTDRAEAPKADQERTRQHAAAPSRVPAKLRALIERKTRIEERLRAITGQSGSLLPSSDMPYSRSGEPPAKARHRGLDEPAQTKKKTGRAADLQWSAKRDRHRALDFEKRGSMDRRLAAHRLAERLIADHRPSKRLHAKPGTSSRRGTDTHTRQRAKPQTETTRSVYLALDQRLCPSPTRARAQTPATWSRLRSRRLDEACWERLHARTGARRWERARQEKAAWRTWAANRDRLRQEHALRRIETRRQERRTLAKRFDRGRFED